MKDEQKKITPEPEVEKKTGPGSDPVNQFKKGATTSAAAIDNIITSAVGSAKHQSSEGFSSKGTVPDYEDEH